MLEKKLSDIDFNALTSKTFFPSPAAWEDQVLYFMMLDRFSDANETGYLDNNGNEVTTGTTPLFQNSEAGNAIQTETAAAAWRDAGGRWQGGNLQGLTSKIGYLKRLGVTALWISPVFKQVPFHETYHGYGIQNFINVDPRFGTREDLKALVETAHQQGIYVILDIILNHSGDVFSYATEERIPPYDNSARPIAGFNDAAGQPTIAFTQGQNLSSHFDNGAIWPEEFQEPATFTKKGAIQNWDNYPDYLEGDFFDLKDIRLGEGPIDQYHPSLALTYLAEAYKFWIAYADIDGFRVDTVKHMDTGATRYFTAVIHEFAQCLGKENFYLIGEITGGRQFAFNLMEETGLNAALGINDIPGKMEYLVKGYVNPEEYFNLFRNSELIGKGSHTWFKNKVVTLFDDHDQVRKGNNKARFCAFENGNQFILNAAALNATTLGIPCLYYGTEQAFDGEGGNDRYIRENMFGGEFGAFRSKDRHFFNENNPLYQEIAKILAIRKKKIEIRRGRQYLREISSNGIEFGLPKKSGNELRSIIAWSRIFDNREMLLAISTNAIQELQAWITIDFDINKEGDMWKRVYSSQPAQIGDTLVAATRSNRRAVLLPVPAHGFVIYERST